MKRIIISLISFLTLILNANAQITYEGDLNKDGVLDVKDVTRLVNQITGKEKIKTFEELISGTWQTHNKEVLNLFADGTTDYQGAKTFKYKPAEKSIQMYDQDNNLVNVLSVIESNSAYLVLKELGKQEGKIYYNEFLIAHPVIEVVHDTIVEYKPYTPTIGDKFEAVDLGLPSGKLWANMNLYANSPEEVGYYYAWGEEFRKASYTSSNYVGSPSFDLATKVLGEGWSMPTKEEFQELINYCICTVDKIGEISGLRYTGFNGNSIFLPYNGYYDGNGRSLITRCIYPSKTIYKGTTYTYVTCLSNKVMDWNYYYNSASPTYYFYKYCGYNIRPIYIPSSQE